MKRTPHHLWRSVLTLLLAFAMVAPFIVPPLKIVAQDVTIDCGWDGGTITDDGTGNKVLSVSTGSAVSGKFTVYQGFSYTATADIIGDGSIDIVFYDKDGTLLADTAGASSTGSTDEIAPFGATQAVISLNATGTAAFDNILNAAVDMYKEADSLQKAAEEAEISFALGYTDSIHDLALAQQKANISLQYTVKVTNAVVSAYKELMTMQL